MHKSRKILVSVGFLLGAFALSVLAADWTAPKSSPPTCNAGDPGCDAPINVGSNSQYKKGSLSIGSSTSPASGLALDVYGSAWVKNGLHVQGLLEAANNMNASGTVSINGTVNIISTTTKIAGKTVYSGTALDTNYKIRTGSLQISGGSPGAGKLLVSDASGNASWTAPNQYGSSAACVGQGGAFVSILLSPETDCANVAGQACGSKLLDGTTLVGSCKVGNYEAFVGAASGGGYWTTCGWTCVPN